MYVKTGLAGGWRDDSVIKMTVTDLAEDPPSVPSPNMTANNHT